MKKSKVIAFMLMIVMVTSILLAGCAPKSAQTADVAAPAEEKKDDYVIKLGYYNCDHMTAACIGKDAGIFDELGLKVEVTGNGKVPTAMAAGQMDVGYIGITGLLQASLKGAPIMIAANNHLGGSMYLVVSDKIKEPKDLIGKKLGIGSKPEEDQGWMIYSKQLGIPLEGSNYQCIDFGSQKDRYLALKTGQIDGFTCCDPWGSMAEFEKTGRILSTCGQYGDGQWGVCCTYSMNRNFVKDHPDLAKKMILAHSKSIEYIYTHPIKAAKIFAKNYNVPEEVALMTIYKKTVFEGRTLTWKVDPKQFNYEIDWEKEHKIIDSSLKYENVIDTQYLDASGADDFDTFIKEKVDPIFPEKMSYEDWYKKAQEIDI